MILKANSVKIMLIDSNTIYRKQLKEVLDNHIDETEVVSSLSETANVLTSLNKTPVDMILMDMPLYDINDIQLTKAIKKSHPEIVIIGIFTYLDYYRIRSLLKVGASQCIDKGIDPIQLKHLFNYVPRLRKEQIN
ncbi:MAG: response regulator transcription factor [Flavobacteriales bacterium]|nr:response regulator transcription factor [Flavobacteriales bacterium]